MLVAFMLLLLS